MDFSWLHPVRSAEDLLEKGKRDAVAAAKPYIVALAVYLVVIALLLLISAVALVKLAFF